MHLVTLAAATLGFFSQPVAPVWTPIPDDSCACPLNSAGWVLFDDSSHRVPTFWRRDSLEVQQISVCPLGVTFRFLGEEAGNLYVAALVFVNPSGSAWSLTGERSYNPEGKEDCQRKYDCLLTGLRFLSGGALGASGRIDFSLAATDQKPWILKPGRQLTLRWGNRELLLRGYLDVFLSGIS